MPAAVPRELVGPSEEAQPAVPHVVPQSDALAPPRVLQHHTRADEQTRAQAVLWRAGVLSGLRGVGTSRCCARYATGLSSRPSPLWKSATQALSACMSAAGARLAGRGVSRRSLSVPETAAGTLLQKYSTPQPALESPGARLLTRVL
jgi:hypothetical protein